MAEIEREEKGQLQERDSEEDEDQGDQQEILEDDDQLQVQEEEGPDVVSEGEHKPFYKSVHKKLNTKAAPYEEHKTATKFGGISSLEPTVGS